MNSSPKFQKLPAGPEPKKKLTARAAAQSLYEHYLGFMAANNLNGFTHDPEAADESTITPPSWITADLLTPAFIQIMYEGAMVSLKHLKEAASAAAAPSGVGTPLPRGYAQGMRYFHDSFIESRSAAKSLIFSSRPLNDSEYHRRRLKMWEELVACCKS